MPRIKMISFSLSVSFDFVSDFFERYCESIFLSLQSILIRFRYSLGPLLGFESLSGELHHQPVKRSNPTQYINR